MARVAVIDVIDDPRLWVDCGFAVDADGACRTGSVSLRLCPPEEPTAPRGVLGWALAGIDTPPAGTLDGVPTAASDAPPASPAEHPNGTLAIDHVVVTTPDLDRTVRAAEDMGLELRRRRDGLSMGREVRQAFFRLEEVVLEVVGPADDGGGAGDAPARIWGLAFTVADLDATVASLGDHAGAARAAVQPGRRIASVRRSAGLSIPVAFLTPEPR